LDAIVCSGGGCYASSDRLCCERSVALDERADGVGPAGAGQVSSQGRSV
jgi:hypothetical protein